MGKVELRDLLKEKRETTNLNECTTWLRGRISDIENGLLVPFNSSYSNDDELEVLAEEINIASEGPDNITLGSNISSTIKDLTIEEKFNQDLGWGEPEIDETGAINDLIDCKDYIKSKLNKNPNPKSKRGNPNFKRIDLPEELYKRAIELVNKFQNKQGEWKTGKSNNWLYKLLDKEFFDGNEKKVKKIERELKSAGIL